jgi:hypothetical protein
MITGRAWRDLPIVIILGLVIGLVFGQIVKLTSPEPTGVVVSGWRPFGNVTVDGSVANPGRG